MDRVAMRNPDNRKNPMTLEAFQAKVPALDLDTYLASSAVPPVTRVNVTSVKFYDALNATIREVPLEDWKTYFRFRVVSDGQRREVIAGHRVCAVDATGAGDCFDGAFIARVVAGDDVFTAARYANAAAALATTGYGAVAPLPRVEDVERLLAAA